MIVSDIIGAQIVELVTSMEFVERYIGRALGDIIQEVAVVRRGENHVRALGHELAEGAARVGGIRNAFDENRLQFRKSGLYGLHSLVKAPGPAPVVYLSGMAA